MQTTYVSFDAADRSFTFYTSIEWHNLIADAREALLDERELVLAGGTIADVLSRVHGDQFFWEKVA